MPPKDELKSLNDFLPLGTSESGYQIHEGASSVTSMNILNADFLNHLTQPSGANPKLSGL